MPEHEQSNALHPRIEELLELLAETRAALTMAAAAVAPGRRSLRPAEDRWSVGEILDHVARVESSFTRLLNKRVGDARARGHENETDDSSVLGRFGSEGVVDRTRRIEAPPIVRPQQGASAEEGLVALRTSRIGLRTALANASGLALGTITQAHPFFGVLDMYQWAIVLGYHDLRHAAQIREIADGSSSG